MRNVLIAYPSMGIGGSTTSLLGLLQSLDYSKVNVDLQLYENQGVLLQYLPKEVHLLPQARIFLTDPIIGAIQRLCHPLYWEAGIRSVLAKKKYPGTLASAQITAQARAKTSRRNTKQYDVAIGFLEMWSDAYVASQVQANVKIAWIHVDYIKAGMVPKYDDGLLACFDKIVLVSDECTASFIRTFPHYRERAISIENILHQKTVKQRADESAEKLLRVSNGIQFGTVCRIEFRHKGLDRVLRALNKLHEEGYSFDWHVIGEGSDKDAMMSMIKELNLERYVHLYGSKANPLPLVKQFDCFLLPSHYEGKPMAVTEAQMLGIPVIATRYASAGEQILSGENGYIMENSEEGILNGIRLILSDVTCIERWKSKLQNMTWDNKEAVQKINSLLGVEE